MNMNIKCYLFKMHQILKQPFNLIHTQSDRYEAFQKETQNKENPMEENKERVLCEKLSALSLKEGKHITWLQSQSSKM